MTELQRELPVTSGRLREVHLSACQTAVVNFTSVAEADIQKFTRMGDSQAP